MIPILKNAAIVGLIATLSFPAISFADGLDSSKNSQKAPPHGPSFKGQRAPNFVLHDPSGKPVSLRDFAGKPVIVNFWATWCPPCLQEMPWFEELNRKYAESGVNVLGLSVDAELDSASPQQVAAIAKRLGVTYPILFSESSVTSLYGGVHQLPETFYIDRNGVIAEDVWGHSSKEMIDKYIREIIE